MRSLLPYKRAGWVYLLLSACAIFSKADVQPAFGCAGRAIIGSFDTSSGDGGPAAQAQLFNPGQMAVDSHGNVYIVDTSNNRVRKVTASGIIGTFAGNGTIASTGDGAQATQASLNRPGGVAVDAAGNVYVSETNGNRIRKISPEGIISTYIGPTSSSPTITAALAGPADLAADSHGNLVVSDPGNRRLIRVGQDGTITTVAGGISANPGGANGVLGTQTGFGGGSIAIAPNGDVLISDTASGNIYSIDANDVLHNVTYGPGPPPSEGANALQVSMTTEAIAIASDGGILVVVSPGTIWEVKPTGLLHQIVRGGLPGSINRIVAGPGNSVLASIGNSVYSFSASGQQTLFAGVPVVGFAGDGKPAAAAVLENIGGLAVDKKGDIYISDSGNNRIRRVSPDGTISTIAGTGDYTPSGDGGPAIKAQLAYPLALAFDPFGNLYVAEEGSNSFGSSVRKIDTDGTITNFAGKPGPPPLGCPTDAYYCPPASGKAVDASISVSSIALDSKGQIFLLDVPAQIIFKVDLEGNISIFARLQDQFPDSFVLTQMQIDGSDNLYSIDPVSGYSVIVSPDGQVHNTNWTSASGFAVDAHGNLYLTGGGILKQTPAGALSTIWDMIVSPYFYEALFPLTFDASGNLYFGDQARNRLFEIPDAASCQGAQRPLVSGASPVNAASYNTSFAVPGELITIFGFFLGPTQGKGPTVVGGSRFDSQTGGVQVLFDGIPAPMLYASAGQVSAVVPYGIAGQSMTNVEVDFSGATSDLRAVEVGEAAPGIFTRDSSGQGQAAAQNQDGTPNGPSHPAPKGSTIVIFATGAGVTKPASVDGAIAGASPPVPVLPVTATVGGQMAKVAYAGGAPFEVNGILQVNLVIPEGASSGSAIPLAIQVGTAQSQTGVTIAIQ